jgi:hypothetical protein
MRISAVAVLYYSYIYDVVFMTKCLKSNIMYSLRVRPHSMRNSGCAPELHCVTFKKTKIFMVTDVEMFDTKFEQQMITFVTL